MYLIYVRHGDPIYNPDSLTELGLKQADALVERLTRLGFDKIYCSSSTRAVLTAKPTADALGIEPVLLDWAREDRAWEDFALKSGDRFTWCFWDSETIKKFTSDEVIKLGYDWHKSPLFEGTNFSRGITRIRKQTTEFLEGLGYRYDEKTHSYSAVEHVADRVALFAHGGFGMAFLSCLLEIPYPLFSTHFEHLNTTGVCAIEIKDEGERIIPRLLEFGNDSHLFKAGLPLYFNGKDVL